MQRVHFQFGVGVFNCQQILTKISFVIFNIVVKNKSNVVLAWSVFLSIFLLIAVIKICCETIDLFMHDDISRIFTGIQMVS